MKTEKPNNNIKKEVAAIRAELRAIGISSTLKDAKRFWSHFSSVAFLSQWSPFDKATAVRNHFERHARIFFALERVVQCYKETDYAISFTSSSLLYETAALQEALLLQKAAGALMAVVSPGWTSPKSEANPSEQSYQCMIRLEELVREVASQFATPAERPSVAPEESLRSSCASLCKEANAVVALLQTEIMATPACVQVDRKNNSATLYFGGLLALYPESAQSITETVFHLCENNLQAGCKFTFSSDCWFATATGLSIPAIPKLVGDLCSELQPFQLTVIDPWEESYAALIVDDTPSHVNILLTRQRNVYSEPLAELPASFLNSADAYLCVKVKNGSYYVSPSDVSFLIRSCADRFGVNLTVEMLTSLFEPYTFFSMGSHPVPRLFLTHHLLSPLAPEKVNQLMQYVIDFVTTHMFLPQREVCEFQDFEDTSRTRKVVVSSNIPTVPDVTFLVGNQLCLLFCFLTNHILNPVEPVSFFGLKHPDGKPIILQLCLQLTIEGKRLDAFDKLLKNYAFREVNGDVVLFWQPHREGNRIEDKVLTILDQEWIAVDAHHQIAAVADFERAIEIAGKK